MFWRKVVEKIKEKIVLSIFFFEIYAVHETMW